MLEIQRERERNFKVKMETTVLLRKLKLPLLRCGEKRKRNLLGITHEEIFEKAHTP